MWIREIKETLRQCTFIMAFYVLIPLLYLMDVNFYGTGLTFLEYMSNGFDLLVLITMVSIAYNMFSKEEEDGAIEYLFSLPLSRWKLFQKKVLPRTLIVLILMGTAAVIDGFNSSESIFRGFFIHWWAGPVYLIGFVLFVQVCGFILNMAGRDSWSSRIIVLFIVFCVWQGCSFASVISDLIWKFNWRASVQFFWYLRRNGFAFINVSVLILLTWQILRNMIGTWDMRSGTIGRIRLQKCSILPLAAFALFLVYRMILYRTILFWFW